jgi:PHD finger-like domain-containing protein 5A
MAKHHPDLVVCRKQPGVAIGRLCEKCKLQAAQLSLPSCMPSPHLTSPYHISFNSLLLAIQCTGDGLCCVCNSFVNPQKLVHICDECNYGSLEGRCVICGNQGVTDAYYCRECVQLEKDRDGCPKILNLGSTRTDMIYDRKKYGFKKR